jgi:hypothetical protein
MRRQAIRKGIPPFLATLRALPFLKIAGPLAFQSGFYSDICVCFLRFSVRPFSMLQGIRFTLIFYFLLLCTLPLRAQLSAQAQLSVLTCGPGSELYSTFGHTAFRVQDPVNHLDIVYNYGTFDFNTPNFYLKFARGKLLYSLSRERFEDFLYTYELENRWVKEQLLRLTDHQKNELMRFLEINYQPDNREYKYDFLFNNCSTKIPEVLGKVLGAELHFKEDYLENQYTFRQLIHQYLETNSWSSLGIDLALGAVIDRKASTREHTFLPDYVLRQLNHTELDNKPLVIRERSILKNETTESGRYITMSPAFWFLLALMFTVAITVIDYKNHSRSRILDFIVFFSTGFVGLIIFLLWFFTDHTATAWNLNLLWSFPLNIIAAWHLVRIDTFPKWMPAYLLALLVLLALTALIWLFKIQVFSPLLVLVWLCLGLRYAFLYRHYRGKIMKMS